jgi:rubredoxin
VPKTLKCQICGYEWTPRDPDVLPRQCPLGKHYNWNKPPKKKPPVPAPPPRRADAAA